MAPAKSFRANRALPSLYAWSGASASPSTSSRPGITREGPGVAGTLDPPQRFAGLLEQPLRIPAFEHRGGEAGQLALVQDLQHRRRNLRRDPVLLQRRAQLILSHGVGQLRSALEEHPVAAEE